VLVSECKKFVLRAVSRPIVQIGESLQVKETATAKITNRNALFYWLDGGFLLPQIGECRVCATAVEDDLNWERMPHPHQFKTGWGVARRENPSGSGSRKDGALEG